MAPHRAPVLRHLGAPRQRPSPDVPAVASAGPSTNPPTLKTLTKIGLQIVATPSSKSAYGIRAPLPAGLVRPSEVWLGRVLEKRHQRARPHPSLSRPRCRARRRA